MPIISWYKTRDTECPGGQSVARLVLWNLNQYLTDNNGKPIAGGFQAAKHFQLLPGCLGLPAKIFDMRYVIFFLFISLLACKKKEDELGLSRQFMPSGDIAVSTADTLAMLSWKAALFTSGTAVTYTVAISQDSTFATTAHTFTTDTTGIRISDQYLVARKKYYARVRTDGKDTSSSSKWVYSKSFSITGEQLLLPIADSNLIDKSVIFYGNQPKG